MANLYVSGSSAASSSASADADLADESAATAAGIGFKLLAVMQLSSTCIRLKFSHDPIAVSAAGVHDALNPTNYSLIGSTYNAIQSVVAVSGDPQSFDLYTASPLTSGSWGLQVLNIWSDTNVALS